MKEKNNKSLLPDWIGKTPFTPDKKVPCKITEDKYVSFLYGFENTQVELQVFASTDKIFMGEWVLAPGNYYAPAGLHLHGDECYYLLEGESIAFNAETGETFRLNAGEAIIIPKATRHQIFNMSNKRVVAIDCVAPKIWEDDGMGTIIPNVSYPRFFKGTEELTYKKPLQAYFPLNIKKNIDSLGNWPAPGPELRKNKQLIIIKPEDQLSLIHGKERHVLFSFFVSNDYMHLAMLEVPVAVTSELEIHEGDEVIDVVEEELCVRIADSEDERKDDSNYLHIKLKNRERMLIPGGTWHQYINFSNNPVKAFIAIGGKL
jgi:mannose-6-phosphate isomerase-like protein (cupin superfamily)